MATSGGCSAGEWAAARINAGYFRDMFRRVRRTRGDKLRGSWPQNVFRVWRSFRVIRLGAVAVEVSADSKAVLFGLNRGFRRVTLADCRDFAGGSQVYRVHPRECASQVN